MSPARQAGAGTPFQWPESIGYSRQPYASLAFGAWGLTAGPEGVALARFGWADPDTGETSNVQSAGAALGFVLPVPQLYNLQRCYPACNFPSGSSNNSRSSMILRPGMACVLATAGVFRTRFPFGAQAGSQVWTDPASGTAYDANLTGTYVATPFAVTMNGGCNANLPISSFVAPFH